MPKVLNNNNIDFHHLFSNNVIPFTVMWHSTHSLLISTSFHKNAQSDHARVAVLFLHLQKELISPTSRNLQESWNSLSRSSACFSLHLLLLQARCAGHGWSEWLCGRDKRSSCGTQTKAGPLEPCQSHCFCPEEILVEASSNSPLLPSEFNPNGVFAEC